MMKFPTIEKVVACAIQSDKDIRLPEARFEADNDAMVDEDDDVVAILV
jgi:hypothetical protein